jgi:hypothetical protein
MKAFCRTFVLEVDICYLITRRSRIAPDVMKILICSNEVTELYKVGCCESKIAGATVDNIIFVARVSRCRKSEGGKSLFSCQSDVFGTTIVVPLHLVHPLRWGFASPAPPQACTSTSTSTGTRNGMLLFIYYCYGTSRLR